MPAKTLTVQQRKSIFHALVEVQDTGVGRADAERVQGKGFGLAQVRERLSTLYGSHASIDFQATPDEGAHTVITLPLPPRPQAATEPEQAVRAMPSPRVS